MGGGACPSPWREEGGSSLGLYFHHLALAQPAVPAGGVHTWAPLVLETMLPTVPPTLK